MYNERAERIHFFLIILFFTIKRCGPFTPPTGVRIPPCSILTEGYGINGERIPIGVSFI